MIVYLSPTKVNGRIVLAVDLLNPTPAAEARKYKLKQLVPGPRSFFIDIKYPGYFTITTVFSSVTSKQHLDLKIVVPDVASEPFDTSQRLHLGPLQSQLRFDPSQYDDDQIETESGYDEDEDIDIIFDDAELQPLDKNLDEDVDKWEHIPLIDKDDVPNDIEAKATASDTALQAARRDLTLISTAVEAYLYTRPILFAPFFYITPQTLEVFMKTDPIAKIIRELFETLDPIREANKDSLDLEYLDTQSVFDDLSARIPLSDFEKDRMDKFIVMFEHTVENEDVFDELFANLGEKSGRFSLDQLPDVKALKISQQEEMSATELQLVTSLLTNIDWENTRFLEACKKLNVDPGQPIKIRGIRKGGPNLFWFQVYSIVSMSAKLEAGIVDGVILAAVVGLGKTITILASVLWEHGRKYDKYQAAIDIYSEDNDKPKLDKTLAAISKFLPWLVMVPGTLVIQWCKEANKLSRLFQLVIYHTDRKKVPVAMDMQ
ncbi:hypothetical protein EG328_010711 [Venturia inaequalis]|uniref:SNF2 N-terminal domain-containing protein n=1 Tax=Venturia inaequalis TaxID=5025 RepID=A0A8H3U6S6_VENIN|nr:hypothetical protein EG328_010711 [Venturia inaequalis]